MFVGWDTPILLLWLFGFVLIVALSVITYLLVSRITDRRWRRPWWAVAGVIVIGHVVLVQIDGLVSTSLIREKLSTQVGFPAEYVHDESRLTLSADGTATLRNVVLADGIVRNATGRWCLSGPPSPVNGVGRWFIDDSGSARIEADGKVGRLHPDPKVILGWGWQKGYLLTTCQTELATVYVPASDR